MAKGAWEQRLGQAQVRSHSARTAIKKVEKQIDGLVDRIVETDSDRVVKAYQARIAKLKREKIRLEESIENFGKPKHTLRSCSNSAYRFSQVLVKYGLLVTTRSRESS